MEDFAYILKQIIIFVVLINNQITKCPMKHVKRFLISLGIFLSFTGVANAQFYEIANQIPQLLSPALSGSFNYKGYVEVSYLKGLGDVPIDFVDISTTQGFKYADWFFMGVGAGVDIMLPNDHHDYYEPGVMVPLYADFRFLIGDQSKVSANLDLRVGAAFPFNNLIGDENFYLRPSLGVRFPINKNKPKQALNVAFTYQLLVDGCHYWDRHSLGATIGFEW